VFFKSKTIISLMDIIRPERDFEDIYLVFELMNSDLCKIIASD